MTDCLVVGGDASLGAALCVSLAARGQSVAATTRRLDGSGRSFFDLDTLEGLQSLPNAKRVALVAAETRFAECAENPDRTRRINVDAPVAVATAAFRSGGRVLFFSSIAVHDGTVDCPAETLNPTPNSVYGQQKRDAELALLDLAERTGGDLAILRPSKVISPDFPLFRKFLSALLAAEPVASFSDMRIAPVSLDRIIEAATALMLETDASRGGAGIFQLSARDQMDYFQLARQLARAVGADEALVQPQLARETLNPATLWLPKFARMGSARLKQVCGVDAPLASEAVETFLRHNLSVSNTRKLP